MSLPRYKVSFISHFYKPQPLLGYTESGVSDASVSAGRAEPIDEPYSCVHSDNLL
jgi:hypothetical protein